MHVVMHEMQIKNYGCTVDNSAIIQHQHNRCSSKYVAGKSLTYFKLSKASASSRAVEDSQTLQVGMSFEIAILSWP